jgi:F-box protein 11
LKGILIVESSSAIIERNNIHENIKANIAFGGNRSVNTFIIENRIFGGRCEGIFMIETGRGNV